jgi:phosphoribosyl 1,2-cyclic phosphodiesterase
VRVCLWGTRGSIASAGPETVRYGGNTSCVEVEGEDGTIVILDAGTGIRRVGDTYKDARRLDILLTHLHMDHIQGLGFFAPLRDPRIEAHIWGPASTTQSLWTRLTRYLSPPLFPVHLRELECNLHLHEVPCGDVEVGEFVVSSALVCHPDPTVGFRITGPGGTLAYLPDHEPALGARQFPMSGEWTSGYSLAAGTDMLIHDAQYNDDEYAGKPGWGHSSMHQTFQFAALCEARQLVPFHHDPAHSDDYLDSLIAGTVDAMKPAFAVLPGAEGETFDVSPN